MQDLPNAIEQALKYRVEQGNFEVSVFTGQSDFTKHNPSLIVHAESGNESPLGSGNFTVSVSCELRATAVTEELANFRQLSRDVMGQFMDSNLAELLTEENDDLHVFGITNRQFRQNVEDSNWLSVLTFDLYCCLSDLVES